MKMRRKLEELCRVRVFCGLSDEELRNIVDKDPNNGSYAHKICRNCGSFQFSIDGNPATAEIVEDCKYCPGD